MEWKEEGIKAIYIGGIAWVGKLFYDKFKPVIKSIKKIYGQVDSIEKLQNDVAYNRSQSVIDQNRFRALFHTSYEPLFICNMKGELIYANPAWQKMTGFINVNDAYGMGWVKAIPVEDRNELEEQSDRLVEHPGSFDGEVRFKYLHSPNHIIVTECRSETVLDENNIPIEVIGRLKIIS